MIEASYAEKARARKMTEALAIGIDDALISDLVERFYASIRTDDLLGPIFMKHVTDWTPHLARMKDFWASVTLESGRFRGNPMMKHIAVGGLDQQHFGRWLQLWEEAVKSVAPSVAATEVFLTAANRIASSLLTGIQVNRGGLDAISNKKETQSC
ncbi:group III truncated hemoglobin [Parasphingorhabdus sp.]|uniref:group III truncated hemoglobin n=1 Tax=Parasphingorhabdus sp. TaxID=2709688 RepID=UPI003A8DA173